MWKAPLLRLHFIVFLWGFTAILGKLVSSNAQLIVFYRMLFAAIFLYIYLRFISKRRLYVPWKFMLQLIGIGSLMAFHWLLFFQSIKVSNVSIALSCLSLSTLFAAFMEPWIYKRKIDIMEVVIGLVIVVCMSFIFNTELNYKSGIIYGVICAFFGCLFSVLNGKISGKATPGNIIFYEIFGGWAVLAIALLFSGQITDLGQISYKDLALITILAGVFTAYPMLESVSLMRYISPFTMILTVNMEPVYGIIFAFFIFGESEHMSPVFYVASLIMIIAIVANGVIKAKKQKMTEVKTDPTE